MIEVTRVSKSYNGSRALDDVSFSAADGLVTGFVGPNGAGKSTLLRVVAKLTVPDAGQARVDGEDFARASVPGNLLGVFLSAEYIPTTMTARSFLSYVSDVQGLERERADEMISAVGLSAARERPVRTFSLGMRQRLGIGAALLGRPRNLILDEPINGLDPEGIFWLRSCVQDVARRGGSVLLSSHHMQELAQVADEVVMLDRGRVVRSGAIASFVADDVLRTYVEATDLDAAVRLLSARGYITEPHMRGAVVHDAAPEEVGRLLFREGDGATELRLLERSLEQTYFDELGARSDVQGDEHLGHE